MSDSNSNSNGKIRAHKSGVQYSCCLKQVRSLVLGVRPGRQLWTHYKTYRLHREYRKRRDSYYRQVTQNNLPTDRDQMLREVRERLLKRGYEPVARQKGELHTFAFIPQLGWHSHLLPDLRELGELTLFDYASLGFSVAQLSRHDHRAQSARREINDLALTALKEAHRKKPVDWVFCYASGLELRPEFVRRITDELGLPTVCMCLDDKQSWTGYFSDQQHHGQIDLAAVFDLSWTSARVALDWYVAEGGRPIYLAEGFDASTYYPIYSEKKYPVSFIGSCYGFRRDKFDFLRSAGVQLSVFGNGWGTFVPGAGEQVQIINQSSINLGMGGIQYSDRLTNLKSRDFEVSATGGGMYLTSYNSDLAQHFDIGREIVCYANDDEMVELIRYYLKRPDEVASISQRARDRCLREHRWLHRYELILKGLGILS